MVKNMGAEATKSMEVPKIKSKLNFWMISTAVLALIVVVMLIRGGITGGAIGALSSEQAGTKVTNLINGYFIQDGSATLDSVTEESGLYKVTLNYNDNSIPVYITKDGKSLILPNGIVSVAEIEASANQQTATENIPKSDKPTVELYVWGYCPYGVIAQGPLAEVANLLKGSADFEIVPYYDGHGEFETQQNKIQLCIQKYYKDKYWDYASGFVKNIYPICSSSRSVDCDKSESVKLMDSLGIDSEKIMTCVSSEGESLFQAASKKAQDNGVSGSPTLIVNGVKVNVDRTAEAYKTAICSAFNTAPSECSQTLTVTGAATSTSNGETPQCG